MTAFLLPNGKQQFEDINGLPLVGGTIGMYIPATLVPKNTWQDAGQTILNTNPIVLDSRGQAIIYGNGNYRQIVKDALGNLIWDELTAASSNNLNNIFTTDTVATMKALGADNAQFVYLQILGYNSVGDNGGSFTYWDAASTETPDDVTVFQATGVTTGRRKLVNTEVLTSAQAGAVGDYTNVDDTVAMQRLFTVGVAISPQVGAPTHLVISRSKTSIYKITAALTLDVSSAYLDGQGNDLDFEFILTPVNCLTINATNANTNLAPLYGNSREIKNLYVQGPSYISNSSSVGVLIENSNSDFNALLKLYGLSIHGNAIGLLFGNGSWQTQCFGLAISGDGSNPVDTAVQFTNDYAAESVEILSGFIGGNTAFNAPYSNSNCSVSGTHIDGIKAILNQAGASVWKFNHCYSELTRGDDTTALFTQSDAGGSLNLIDYHIDVRDDLVIRTNTAYFNTIGDVYCNGVIFQNSLGRAYLAADGFLNSAAGKIRVTANGIRYLSYPWAPLPCKATCWNAYPDINSANALDGFTTGNSGSGTTPVRVAGVTHGSTRDVIRFNLGNGLSVGATSFATWVQSVDGQAGRRLSVVGSAGGGALTGSNTVFEAVVTYSDGTATISTVTIPLITGTGGTSNYSTLNPASDAGYVPAGTVTATIKIQMRATGTTSGNTTVDVSPLGLGFSE